MRCKECDYKPTRVRETREMLANPRWTYRYRVCPNCNSKFATVELPAVDLNIGPADGDHVVEFDE